jgi:hypothetical protein
MVPAESIRTGEKPRCGAKRGPSILLEPDTLTHLGLNPESVGEFLTRPVMHEYEPK